MTATVPMLNTAAPLKSPATFETDYISSRIPGETGVSSGLVSKAVQLPSGTGTVSVQNPSWVADYIQLTKPRILFMILITVGAGAVCVPDTSTTLVTLLASLLGTLFVAASASVMNQVVEKSNDGMMQRTLRRPLPDGRLTKLEATLFGGILLALGMSILLCLTNLSASLIALATWLLYVGIYTPSKTMSVWNTAVGTLPGAMPVLIGWCAAGGTLSDWRGWMITSIVVLWQFPHFMSIAWLYRQDYEGAGYRMWTTVEPTGIVAGWHASIGAALLIIVALASINYQSPVDFFFGLIILLVAGQQLIAAIKFHQCRDDQTARRLLRSSLLVLPLLLLAVVLASVL